MRLILVCILGLSLISASCKKDNVEGGFPIKAKVLGENIDCHQFEIRILNELDKIIALFGESVVDSVYIAGNLPDSLKISDLEIMLDVGNPSYSIEAPCSFMGPTLNWIWITHAKPYK